MLSWRVVAGPLWSGARPCSCHVSTKPTAAEPATALMAPHPLQREEGRLYLKDQVEGRGAEVIQRPLAPPPLFPCELPLALLLQPLRQLLRLKVVFKLPERRWNQRCALLLLYSIPGSTGLPAPAPPRDSLSLCAFAGSISRIITSEGIPVCMLRQCQDGGVSQYRRL